MILLDTCTLLWIAADQRKISKKAKEIIEINAGALFVSAISALEIATKSRKGRLKLSMAVSTWFLKALEFHGIYEIPLTSDIVISSTKLPMLHSDPFDRIIIATAQKQSGMKICTSDKLIQQYKQADVVW